MEMNQTNKENGEKKRKWKTVKTVTKKYLNGKTDNYAQAVNYKNDNRRNKPIRTKPRRTMATNKQNTRTNRPKRKKT